MIGKGSFGKVFLVRETESGRIYAMKVLTKENIIKRNQVEHTKTERNVLGYVKHPFIVGLNMAFQVRGSLSLLLRQLCHPSSYSYRHTSRSTAVDVPFAHTFPPVSFKTNLVQTKDKLFFVLDYCAGGELFFHLGKLGKFPEARARFYAAEITLALEHVHKLDIIYRCVRLAAQRWCNSVRLGGSTP